MNIYKITIRQKARYSGWNEKEIHVVAPSVGAADLLIRETWEDWELMTFEVIEEDVLIFQTP